MDELITSLSTAPVANLLILGGLIFLGIAVVGKISGKIEPDKSGRIAAGALGTILLIVGFIMHVSPAPSATPPPATLAPQTADVQPTGTPAPPEATPVPPTPAPVAPTETPVSVPTKAVTEPTPLPPTGNPTGVAPVPAGNWQQIQDLPRRVNDLLVDPANPKVLYAGTGYNGSGSGVFTSDDAGLTWRNVSAGLPSEDVKALAISLEAPQILYASLGVRGEIYGSTDGAESWALLADSGMFGGFARRMVLAQSDPKMMFLLEVGDELLRSNDGGHVWVPLSEGLPRDSHDAIHIASLVLDPTDKNVVYAGTGGSGSRDGNGVFKSTDGGETWVPANSGMVDYRITALAIDPTAPETVYAGGGDGELFKTTDGAQTWSALTENLLFLQHEHSAILDIIIDPNVPDTIYMLADGVGVLLSDDGGGHWRFLARPSDPTSANFTAVAMTFDPGPILIVGIRDKGAWRHASTP